MALKRNKTTNHLLKWVIWAVLAIMIVAFLSGCTHDQYLEDLNRRTTGINEPATQQIW